jgi:peptidoglycan/LPS O-acetylase OafA/YrhL
MLHSNNFHFLRFLAASLVIVGHSYPLTGRPDLIEKLSLGLFPTGHIAVCIFFVISGYCVMQSRLQSTSVYAYLMKRVVRIFPGLLGALIFCIVGVGAFNTTLSLTDYFTTPQTYYFLDNLKLYPPTHRDLPGVFLSNPLSIVNGSLWTLAYEFTMYVVLVIIVWFFQNRWNTFVALFSVFFVVYCTFFTFFYATRTLPVIHLDVFHSIDFGIYFLLGMLMYVYRNQVPLKGTLALVLFAAWMMTYLVAETGLIPLSAIVWVRYFSLSYIVLYLAFLKSPFNSFGNYGDFSYGIYIYGFPVQQSIIALLGKQTPAYQVTLLAFIIVLPLAWISWNYIEQPAMRLKRFF